MEQLRILILVLFAVGQVLGATKDAPVKWDRQSDWVDEPPPNMPRVTKLEVVCGKTHMTIHLAFNQPFYGLVFSKGKHRDSKCVYVGPNSGRSEFVFDVYYDDCGTKPDLHGNFYENTVIIQYGTDIIEAWDEAKRMRCEWHNAYEKPAAQPPPLQMADLDIVELNFQGDNIDCWMEIQEGKGPWSREVTNLIPLGSPLTMVIAINDQEGQFDMRVKSCFAHDGHKVPIQLTDEWGCVLRPKMLSPFHKVRDYNSRASVVSYAHFYAFKFPDTMDVHIQCKVEICRHGCPDSCQKTVYKPLDIPNQRHPDGNELDASPGGGYESKHVTIKSGLSKVPIEQVTKIQPVKAAIYDHHSSSSIKAVQQVKGDSKTSGEQVKTQVVKTTLHQTEKPYQHQTLITDSKTTEATDQDNMYHYAPEAVPYHQSTSGSSHTVYHKAGASIQSPYHKYVDPAPSLQTHSQTLQNTSSSESYAADGYVSYNESPAASPPSSLEHKPYTGSSDIKAESLTTIDLSRADDRRAGESKKSHPPVAEPEPNSVIKPVAPIHEHNFQSYSSVKQETYATPRGQNENSALNKILRPPLTFENTKRLPIPVPEPTRPVQATLSQHHAFLSHESRQHFIPPVLYKPPQPHYPYPIPQFVPPQPLFVKFAERADNFPDVPNYQPMPIMFPENTDLYKFGFPQGPRSLRLRRSNADGQEIGVSQVYRAVASVDLAFQPNATTDSEEVYEGRFEEIVYGVCLPITGLALGFGFLLLLTVAALCVCGFMVYHYRLQTYRERRQTLLQTRLHQGRMQFFYRRK